MDAIDHRVRQLDLRLFGHVTSQSTDNDKRSLLAMQTAVAGHHKDFIYLEIGSHKGGSLQPYIVDHRCTKIISIDPRPQIQPDTRGPQPYEANSTSAMLQGLATIPGACIGKIHPIEAGTDTLTPSNLPATPDLCFIDGEHTDEAALRDARFCLAAVRPDGVLMFHDANLIYKGLDAFLQELPRAGRLFHAYVLPDSVFVIELGTQRYCDMEPVRACLDDAYKAYLAGMLANDWYRDAYQLPIYRFLRRIRRLFR